MLKKTILASMNPKLTSLLSILLVVIASHKGFTQTTYTISSNTNWSALSPSPDWCTGCTFNISSGVTLNINSSAGCFNCTFNSGIVTVNSGLSFFGGTLNVDSVAFNTSSANIYPGS